FGVSAIVSEVHRGPAVTRYEVQPATGVKVSRIVSLTDDLALALAAKDIRIEAPIPGKSAIGIEVPNSEVAVVSLREVLESAQYQDASAKLTVALGRDISGEPIVTDLTKMPHLLVAGATGSGKSVCINGLIMSIL
ncbi:DNA translocase FtsK, partial [Microbacteriaceae bacterium K1510]|nr:DNA translocase FtsK [Microbacteriaceae bacterium K1510]